MARKWGSASASSASGNVSRRFGGAFGRLTGACCIAWASGVRKWAPVGSGAQARFTRGGFGGGLVARARATAAALYPRRLARVQALQMPRSRVGPLR